MPHSKYFVEQQGSMLTIIHILPRLVAIFFFCYKHSIPLQNYFRDTLGLT